MSRLTALTKSQSSLIIHMEKCKLLNNLTPENIGAMARHCRKDDIPLSSSKQLLEYNGCILFIVEGNFERVFIFPNQRPIALDELKPGDIWGEHFLISKQADNIGIRSIGKGSLIVMNALRFQSYMERWPELNKEVLMMLLERDIEQSNTLGEALIKLHNNDIVLNRIEGVANLMIDYMSGKTEKDEVYQRRFKIPKKPDNIPHDKTESTIEQAYLTSPEDKEDRIRKEIKNDIAKFSRTTKIGKGMERKQFEREITETEYNELIKEIDGSIIKKLRIKLSEKINKAKISIDIFENQLQNLYIIEADFKTKPDADAFKFKNDPLFKDAKEITADDQYSNRMLALKGMPKTN